MKTLNNKIHTFVTTVWHFLSELQHPFQFEACVHGRKDEGELQELKNEVNLQGVKELGRC